MHFVFLDACNFFTQIRLSLKLLPSGAADTVVLTLKENSQNAPASYTNRVVSSRIPRRMKQTHYWTYIYQVLKAAEVCVGQCLSPDPPPQPSPKPKNTPSHFCFANMEKFLPESPVAITEKWSLVLLSPRPSPGIYNIFTPTRRAAHGIQTARTRQQPVCDPTVLLHLCSSWQR